MKRDIIDAFDLLRHYGIHTVRAKIVDSPEDAIAFAERRASRDPRLVAIGIHVRADDAQALDATRDEPLRTVEAIRAAYERLSRDAEAGTLIAREAIDPGTDIAIAGHVEDGSRRIGVGGVERMVPLGDVGAEVLANHVQAHHHHGHGERTRHMLEHLFERLSKFYEEAGVTSFDVLVRLHENSYTVLDAAIVPAGGRHPAKTKADTNAQDRRSVGIRQTKRR